MSRRRRRQRNRDPQYKKRRNLRKSHFSFNNPSLWTMYERQYKPNKYPRWWMLPGEEVTIFLNQQHQFVYEKINRSEKSRRYSCCRTPPAEFRRIRNRLMRTRSKQIIKRFSKRGDWDNLPKPRYRNDIFWEWW